MGTKGTENKELKGAKASVAESIGGKLKEAREEKKMTQKKLADLTAQYLLDRWEITSSISDSNVSNYERGTDAIPYPVLIAFADVLGKKVGWFFDEECNADKIRGHDEIVCKTVSDVLRLFDAIEKAFHSRFNLNTDEHYDYNEEAYTQFYKKQLHILVPDSFAEVLTIYKQVKSLRGQFPGDVYDTMRNSILKSYSQEISDDLLIPADILKAYARRKEARPIENP